MAHVTLDNVRKVYDNGFEAVREASFTIGDGEFVVFVGPSGCGKSTLLRMIAGLEEITEGTLHIGDRLANDLPPKDRDIAMVFQNYALYPHMSVYENLAFGLKVRKFPKDKIRARVEEAAAILGLTENLDRKPKQLSGGQRQRVAVGRAIVRKPEVFLFDEPLSNLDAKLRVQMRAEISRLHNKLGTTMIYVTHDQVEAMTMGTRIVVMKDGVIQQIAAPLDLYNKPVNQFVAGFIGSPSMNFITGELTQVGSAMAFAPDGGGLTIDLPASISTRLIDTSSRRATMGIRPESLDMAGVAGTEDSVAFGSWQVDVIEPMGNEVILYASRGSNGTAHSVVGRLEPYPLPPSPGSRVDLVVDASRIHFFDAQTEDSLLAAPEPEPVA
jgi:multiple sugar transport system ATP-binding protein